MAASQGHLQQQSLSRGHREETVQEVHTHDQENYNECDSYEDPEQILYSQSSGLLNVAF